MGIFSRLPWGRGRSTAPRASGGVDIVSLDDPRVKEFLRNGGGMETYSGAIINPSAALKVSAANRCTNLICSAVKTVPIDLKRREGKSRVDASDHPLWTVLRKRPNAWQTPSQFRQYMQMCVLNRGNAYAHIVKGARDRIIAFNPLVPDYMAPPRQMSDMTLRFDYHPPGKAMRTFSSGEILHLSGMSMDGITGQSVISCARESLGLSVQNEKHAAKLFKQGISLGSIFTHPKKLNDPGVIDRIKASLEEFRGADNAHKALILEEGITREGIEMKSVDAQFIETREMTLLEIAMFYGVPPHLLGLTTKTTSWGSGIEQQSIAFVAYTLQDWFTMWQESIERDCLDPVKDAELYVRLNPAGLIRGDIKTRYAAYAIGRQWGWLSANDVREKEDMDPIEDGDIYLVPLNMSPADALNAIQALNSIGGSAELMTMMNNAAHLQA